MSGETPSEPAPSTNPVFTIGHSTRSIAAFTALLAEAEIALCVDVRSIPRSRTNPQFNTEILPISLAAAGIGYRHLGALGGRRGRQDDGAPSPNGLWRNAAFRNYADYAMTPAFRAADATLRDHVRGSRVVALPPPHHCRLPARRGPFRRTYHGAARHRAGTADRRCREGARRRADLSAGLRRRSGCARSLREAAIRRRRAVRARCAPCRLACRAIPDRPGS